MQDRGVPGDLVVLVQHVEAERPVRGPVVHRLEGDHRQSPVDRLLGDLDVLYAVRPSPENLPRTHLGEVRRQRLGKQDDVRVREQLLVRTEPADQRPELLVRHAEVLAVSGLEEHPVPQLRLDAVEVTGVDRQPPLVGLARPRDDPDAQLLHARPLGRCPV